MKKPYNGHESWTAWNVALWISNTEEIYRAAVFLKGKYSLNKAARTLKEMLAPRTPDGARYSLHTVKLALRDLE